jgi:C-terminal processing protease CtpA/Prc
MKYFFYLFLLLPVTLFSQTGTEKIFSRQQIKDDISFFVKTVEHVHPNPYHDITKEKFTALTDSIITSLKENTTIPEAWACFSKMIAAYNEGHSSIGYPIELQQQIQDGAIKIFPVLIKEFNGENLVVRYDLSADSVLKTGDLIISINRQSASKLMAKLSSFYGGLPTWRSIQVLRDFAGQLVLHSIQSPYHIGYISGGVKKEITIQPVSVLELQARAAEVRNRNSITATQAPYTFQRTAENIGYLNFRSMSNLPVFSAFLDSVFTDIKDKPVEGLIIDLRQNGGGNSVLGEKLIGYISGKPFRMGGGSKWKVSDEYKAFIQEQAKTNAVYASGSFQQYLNKTTGQIISSTESRTHTAGKNQLRYSGKICVLTGPNTFSSANMLSNAIKDYNLATIIGEATGEACNDYGELYWNKLPNTGLTFYTCSKQFIRANGDAADPNPVLPDIAIKQNPNNLKDEVLEFAKEWVRKK